MKQCSVQCSECKDVIKADNPGQLSRNLGLHKRNVHGIPGQSSLDNRRAYARERHWKLKGYSPEKIAMLHAKYAEIHAAAPANGEPVRKPTKKATDAEPLALTSCPICRARFYFCRGEVKES